MAGFSILKVSQIATYLKSVLDGDSRLKGIYVKGEIADLRDHYSSGHLYFTLKEGGAAVGAVMFRSYAQRMRFRLSDGMAVIARCDVAYYTKDGSCQLYVYDVQPDGIGAKYVALEQLKAKLDAEGLFNPQHKRPLPKLPMCIGVVTSASGAALQDILRVLGRRWPMAEVIVTPALVQGEGAAGEIAEAIRKQNICGRADVLIVGRGGGSSDDLFAFNDEAVARAVYGSRIPVISAVGHETDYTLCDFAADARAATPSAAAELASPDMDAMLSYMRAARSLLFSDLSKSMERRERGLARNVEALRRAEALYMKGRQDELTRKMELLEARSPINLLKRGYAAVTLDGTALDSLSRAKVGSMISVRLSDGELLAEIKNIRKAGAI